MGAEAGSDSGGRLDYDDERQAAWLGSVGDGALPTFV
jgi:hypothetical protein